MRCWLFTVTTLLTLYPGLVADLTVFVTGASETEVVEAVTSWAESVGLLDFSVEEADIYPGFTVAVDLFSGDEVALERLGQQLVDALPFAASTEVDLEINKSGRHLRSI